MIRQGQARGSLVCHWGQIPTRRERARPPHEGSRTLDRTASTGRLAHCFQPVVFVLIYQSNQPLWTDKVHSGRPSLTALN